VIIAGSSCASLDAYGSNECDLQWGTNYTVDVDATLAEDIVSGHSFTVDLKLDGLIPFKFTCALCGANCSITIPLIKQDVTFSMPACPLAAGPLKMTATLPLPATSPVPIKASVKGTVTVQDPSGTTVADVSVNGAVSPSLAAGGQCSKASYAFCCGVGKPCDCTKGTTSPGQCKPESYAFCCDVGTPCDCTKPGIAFLA
jgi:hypothetical protein